MNECSRNLPQSQAPRENPLQAHMRPMSSADSNTEGGNTDATAHCAAPQPHLAHFGMHVHCKVRRGRQSRVTSPSPALPSSLSWPVLQLSSQFVQWHKGEVGRGVSFSYMFSHPHCYDSLRMSARPCDKKGP